MYCAAARAAYAPSGAGPRACRRRYTAAVPNLLLPLGASGGGGDPAATWSHGKRVDLAGWRGPQGGRGGAAVRNAAGCVCSVLKEARGKPREESQSE
jgi:hypothetical protein